MIFSGSFKSEIFLLATLNKMAVFLRVIEVMCFGKFSICTGMFQTTFFFDGIDCAVIVLFAYYAILTVNTSEQEKLIRKRNFLTNSWVSVCVCMRARVYDCSTMCLVRSSSYFFVAH